MGDRNYSVTLFQIFPLGSHVEMRKLLRSTLEPSLARLAVRTGKPILDKGRRGEKQMRAGAYKDYP